MRCFLFLFFRNEYSLLIKQELKYLFFLENSNNFFITILLDL